MAHDIAEKPKRSAAAAHGGLASGDPALAAIFYREFGEAFGKRGALARLLAFAGVVAIALFLAWPREPKLLIYRDRISDLVFSMLTGALQLMILLFGPAGAALSVTRDREQGSLEMICAAPLGPVRLLQAKALAHAAYLWLLTAATLPMASATYLLGGVEGWRIAVLYIEAFFWASAVAAVGVSCSARARNSSAALALAYARVLPFGAFWIVFPRFHALWIALPAMALIPLLRSPATLRRLRHPHDSPAGDVLVGAEGPETGAWAILRRMVMPGRSSSPMRDWVNPLWMRELRYEVLGGAALLHLLIPAALTMGVLGAGAAIFFTGGPGYFFLILHAAAFVLVPAGCAPSIAREFDLGTADSLRATLLKPFSIVWPKAALGIHVALVPLALPLAVALPVLGYQGLLAPADMYLWLAMLAATLVLTSGAGVFFSLLCRSASQAMLACYGVLALVFAGAPALCVLLRIFTDLAPSSYAWIGLASPATALMTWSAEGVGGDGWRAILQGLYLSPGVNGRSVAWAYIAMAGMAGTCLLAATTAGLTFVWRKRSRR